MTSNLSENYHLRKHFLNTDGIPTQSLIKKKMTAPLAAIYFKTMNPKLKVMVGLEPPMQGGGGDWYVPPKELLEGRTVLKPFEKKYLSKLNYLGIDDIGMKFLDKHLKHLEKEKERLVAENDTKWKDIIEEECQQFHELMCLEEAKKNTDRILYAFNQFSHLYAMSLTKIEHVLTDAASKEIKKIKHEAFKTMQDKYNVLIKHQATSLYDMYTDRMMTEKARLKKEFADNLAANKADTEANIHDIIVEKHVAIEKSRKYMECQRLACQVYVALKEREECQKEIDQVKYAHKKQIRNIADIVACKDHEVNTLKKKEKRRLEFEEVWQKKVWHIVKKLQILVSYCLNLLPSHEEFFINMEKLILLQLNEVLKNPSAENIFVLEKENYEGPRPDPHPFYLFCDKIHKYETGKEKHLCPKNCTSSASQMPVIVINKRCLYAACDNFQQFTNKAKSFIYGQRGDDIDFTDDNIYEHYVPVKYTSSQQLLELKLEDSILQILQQELPNIRNIPIECGICKKTYCFCQTEVEIKPVDKQKIVKDFVVPVIPKTYLEKNMTRSVELEHQREPKWESYMRYVQPIKCVCPKTAKKHLEKHLPIYMTKTTGYNAPDLPNYEMCSPFILKKLVREAKGKMTPPLHKETVSKTRDVETQCSDAYYEQMCTCFSEDELRRLFIQKGTAFELYHLTRTPEEYDILDSTTVATMHDGGCSSMIEAAQSVLAQVDDIPELKEIFRSKDRSFH